MDSLRQPPQRHPHRLEQYDYSQPGGYFVTICTRGRTCLFGHIVDGSMALNAFGEIVWAEFVNTAALRPRVTLDSLVIMPNHVHTILLVTDTATTSSDRAFVRTERFGQPTPDSLPTAVRLLKSATTSRINALRGTPGQPIWQRNYYEHVIRNDDSLHHIREYIANNPASWALDRENPAYTPGASAPLSPQHTEPWEV